MSENKTLYMAAGVFKLDYRSAGYPDLIKIAKEWAAIDSHFHELIVRKVSENNFGIQFVYLSNKPQENNIKKYKEELIEKFTKGSNGLYAWDINESTSEYDSKGDESKTAESIVVLKEFNRDQL